MRVRILTRLNSAYGTFEVGHIVDDLPEDVAAAWVQAGVAEVPVIAAAAVPQVLADKPELDEAINTDDAQPIAAEPVVKARLGGSPRPARRTAHPSAAQGPTWGDKG